MASEQGITGSSIAPHDHTTNQTNDARFVGPRDLLTRQVPTPPQPPRRDRPIDKDERAGLVRQFAEQQNSY